MVIKSQGLWALAALAVIFGGKAAFLPDETYVPETKDYCLTGQPGKNPIQIIAADDGRVVREGREKAFKVDENARTCAYTDKSGETMIYFMK